MAKWLLESIKLLLFAKLSWGKNYLIIRFRQGKHLKITGRMFTPALATGAKSEFRIVYRLLVMRKRLCCPTRRVTLTSSSNGFPVP